ncbi:Uncharacterised protein [Vibrio cholerae]|uniref:Uncharacterized protein n=1 Tax=Vibrio cholerae TaxID=666 RepID=A0A655VVG7_VIBCL|nr:Uncharacterised protein [Vibrio cholerae]
MFFAFAMLAILHAFRHFLLLQGLQLGFLFGSQNAHHLVAFFHHVYAMSHLLIHHLFCQILSGCLVKISREHQSTLLCVQCFHRIMVLSAISAHLFASSLSHLFELGLLLCG